MDLRLYYQKIRDYEEKIEDEFPVVESRDTGDGGKAGTLTEVPRRLAAKMVVDGIAQVVSPAQKKSFLDGLAEAKRLADQLEAASQVRVTVLSSTELDRLRNAGAASTR